MSGRLSISIGRCVIICNHPSMRNCSPCTPRLPARTGRSIIPLYLLLAGACDKMPRKPRNQRRRGLQKRIHHPQHPARSKPMNPCRNSYRAPMPSLRSATTARHKRGSAAYLRAVFIPRKRWVGAARARLDGGLEHYDRSSGRRHGDSDENGNRFSLYFRSQTRPPGLEMANGTDLRGSGTIWWSMTRKSSAISPRRS